MIATEITTLEELIDALDNAETSNDYRDVVRYLELEDEEVEPFCFVGDGKYTRNCIKRTDDYELLALVWNKGQYTSIHNHAKQECWMYVQRGTLEEERFKMVDGEPEKIGDGTLTRGQYAYITDEQGVHRLINKHDGVSVSLHLYVGPIDRCSQYDEESGEFNVNQLSYYSHEGKILEEQ